jgi:hypothetical protein
VVVLELAETEQLKVPQVEMEQQIEVLVEAEEVLHPLQHLELEVVAVQESLLFVILALKLLLVVPSHRQEDIPFIHLPVTEHSLLQLYTQLINFT